MKTDQTKESKLVSEYNGEVVTMTQYIEGESLGSISMSIDEASEARDVARNLYCIATKGD